MRFVSFETAKPTEHPQEIMDLLGQLGVGEIVYDPGNFQNRIKQINQLVKLQSKRNFTEKNKPLIIKFL